MPTAAVEPAPTRERLGRWWPAVCALAAYIPALLSSPGRMPADTKLALYLDPARLTSESVQTFDPAQYAGWVPHQQIAYLWPSGPWYSVFELVGSPDWVAHRLWIGTLLFAAGSGVGWALRRLGLTPLAALTGALVYQLSPYVLPYVSRTSSLLLPFAGFGWIMGATYLATRDQRRLPWRWVAVVALVVATIGAVNATALIMIVPGPLAMLFHSRRVHGVPWRRIGLVAALGGGMCTAVSVWWIAMSAVQRTHGPDVLAYSESLEAVSASSTSMELVRGLGYWLFYVRDHLGATTTASIDLLDDPVVVAAGFTVVILSLLGLLLGADGRGLLGAWCVTLGVVVGVGVHPLHDPSPLIDALVGDGDSGLALALRSSARAGPVVLFGLALGAATLVQRAPGLRPFDERFGSAAGPITSVLLVGLAFVATPSWWTAALVDPGLDRDQEVPDSWVAAAEALDGGAGRVLQIPGAEFGAFEWGVTVDQPLPYLTDRAAVTRDLLPLGSPAAMDLVFALDDRMQDGVFEPTALAAVARWLGVDRVWVAGDLDVQRYDTARPGVVLDAIERTGEMTIERFGSERPRATEVIDERLLGVPAAALPMSDVALVDPGAGGTIVRVRPAGSDVVLVGSGDGAIDAAAAGVLDGTELLLAAPAVDGPVDRLVVTDSNRKRAHQWRTSQDVHGFTEAAGVETVGHQAGDERLPVFEGATDREPTDADRTVSVQRGPATASATGYGQPFAYLPEHRPSMALDGDPATTWTVAEHADPRGHRLFVDVAPGSPPSTAVSLHQPARADERVITRVRLTVDDGVPTEVVLDDRSHAAPGQTVDLTEPIESRLVIEIAEVSDGRANGVGFAEVDIGLGPTTEWILTPTSIPSVEPDASVDVVVTRLRAEATDRWRDDPEPELRRSVTLPEGLDGPAAALTATVRLDPRASGFDLAELLDDSVVASEHLLGAPGARGAAAVDGDPSTSWITPFGSPIGPSLASRTLRGTIDELHITQPDGPYSRITRLEVADAAGSMTVAVTEDPIRLERPVDLASATFTIVDAELATTIDRRFGDEVVLPAAISELGIATSVTELADDRIAADCDPRWLRIDGDEVALSFTASIDELVAGDPIEATPCSTPFLAADAADTLDVHGRPGAGIQIDRVTIRFGPHSDTAQALDQDALDQHVPEWSVPEGPDPRSVTIDGCPTGCWVVLGHGFNPAWNARIDAGPSLGSPQLVDANANGWWLEPFEHPTTVHFDWTAQTPVTMGVVTSALAVVALVAALMIAARRRESAEGEPETVSAGDPAPGPWWIRSSAHVVAAILLIGPVWGVAAVGVAALVHPGVARARPIGRAVALAAVGFIAACAAAVVFVVAFRHPAPDLAWPAEFERWHRPVLFALSTLVVGLTADRAERLGSHSIDGSGRYSRPDPAPGVVAE